MNNNRIGIKLADGSFYPILEEGVPQTKTLELTTVRDDQTTVQLDLYKSDSDELSDQDYVDSLLIKDLLPRPKEVPSLILKISLDENDVLSAEIKDSETGEHNQTSVSLVKLEDSQRTSFPDFSVIKDFNGLQENLEENMAGDKEDMNLDEFGDIDSILEEGSDPLNDFSEQEIDIPTGNIMEDESLNIATAEDSELFTSMGTSSDSENAVGSGIDEFSIDDDFSSSSIDVPTDSVETTSTSESSDDFELPNLDENSLDSSSSDLEASSSIDDFELPNLDENSLDSSSSDAMSFETDSSVADDINFDDIKLPEDDFDPDSFDIEDKEFVGKKTADFDSTSNMEFSALYDKDTFDETSSAKKRKLLVSVLIVCVCALLCIAILAAFFLFGKKGKSKKNIPEVKPIEKISKKKDKSKTLKPEKIEKIEKIEKVFEEKESPKKEKIDEIIELTSAESAKEDEIIIVEQPVVKPAVPIEKKSNANVIKYKVKWGDTLWDISKTYYKNPWLYVVIAEYNHLEDPDIIISGAILDIPPR
ncbi:MAG: LysM peptidoglycan-binding domain-containing protein [Treponemataceae bacterium]